MTKNLIDHVIGEKTEFVGGIKTDYIYKVNPELRTKIANKHTTIYGYNGTDNGKNRVYISSRKAYQKCMTFDMPFIKNKKILLHSILLNNTIFFDSKRPKKHDFSIFFHYPHQTLRKTAVQSLWGDESKLLNQTCSGAGGGAEQGEKVCPYYQRSYTTTFNIDNVQVLKSRNKPKAMCIENWKKDDVEVRTLISKRLKCQPNHWKLGLNLANCVTTNQMKNATISEDLSITPSCRTIERYSFSVTEQPGLFLFDIETDEFENSFKIDWNSEKMKSERVSEINIQFIGNSVYLCIIYNFDLYFRKFLCRYRLIHLVFIFRKIIHGN